MLTLFRKWRTRAIWKDATEALRSENYERALQLSAGLEREHYSGAFDVRAQAYAGLGRMEEAIACLESGLRMAPAAWLNWELLGNYRSDLGLFNEAAEAYTSALKCSGVRVDSIRLNQAILAERKGEHETAISLVDSIKDADFRIQATDLKARALLDLGRPADALALCEAFQIPARHVERYRDSIGRIGASQATAMLALGRDPEDVRRALQDMLDACPSSIEALNVVRRLTKRPSTEATLFSVTLNFEFDAAAQKHTGAAGYLRSGRVLANSPEEAVTYLSELESKPTPPIKPDPEVSAIESVGSCDRGVLSRSPRIFYEAGN